VLAGGIGLGAYQAGAYATLQERAAALRPGSPASRSVDSGLSAEVAMAVLIMIILGAVIVALPLLLGYPPHAATRCA
jgi:hypothetical protein